MVWWYNIGFCAAEFVGLGFGFGLFVGLLGLMCFEFDVLVSRRRWVGGRIDLVLLFLDCSGDCDSVEFGI